jgi:hypothetical protein
LTFDRLVWLAKVGDSIAQAVARRDTQHAIFHGCYDWHSAVHGHWALLRIARVTGESRFSDAATAELTHDRITTEARLLHEQPRFEMPYGRAWFLRLAIELEITELIDATRLRSMAAQVASSLVKQYAEVAPYPDAREYASASWALVQLAAWAKHTSDRALAATAQRLIEDTFLDPGDVPGLSHDHERSDFFSPRANWLYLIAHTQPMATLVRMLDAAALDDAVLAPVLVNGSAHHYGVNWSRAWMLHRLALVGPPGLRELCERAYAAHVAVGIRDHERAAGDYMAYGHWVPQFAVYALTEDAVG